MPRKIYTPEQIIRIYILLFKRIQKNSSKL